MKRLSIIVMLFLLLFSGCVAAPADDGGAGSGGPERQDETNTVFPSWLSKLRAGMSPDETQTITGLTVEGNHLEILAEEAECSFYYNLVDELVAVNIRWMEDGIEPQALWVQLTESLKTEYGSPAIENRDGIMFVFDDRDNPLHNIIASIMDYEKTPGVMLGVAFKPTEIVPIKHIDPKGPLSALLTPSELDWDATILEVYSALGYVMMDQKLYFTDPNNYTAEAIPTVGAGFMAEMHDTFELYGVRAYNELIMFEQRPGDISETVDNTQILGYEYTFLFDSQAEGDEFKAKVMRGVTEIAGEGEKEEHAEKRIWTVNLSDEAIKVVELNSMPGMASSYGIDKEQYYVTLNVYTKEGVYKIHESNWDKNATILGSITEYKYLEIWINELNGDGTPEFYWCHPDPQIYVLASQGQPEVVALPQDAFSDYVANNPNALYSIVITDGSVTEIVEQVAS